MLTIPQLLWAQQERDPHGFRPAEILELIKKSGADKAVKRLSSDWAEWDKVLNEIATGAAVWLGVAKELRPGTDAATAETLEMAIQEALPRNPKEVLSITTLQEDSRNAFPVQRACGGYGFGQFGDERPTHVLVELVRKRETAVGSVREPGLEDRRRACLRQLMQVEKELSAPPAVP